MSTIQERKLERSERILRSIDEMEYTTIKQIQKVHDLGSYRNAHKVLSGIDSYLKSERKSVKVFYLNANGKKLIGSEKETRSPMLINHILMRNEAWIYFNCPIEWVNDVAVEYEESAFKGISIAIGHSLNENKKLIPDSIFKFNGATNYLEVDNTRHMIDNKAKIKKYKKAIPYMAKKLGHTPILHFVTTTNDRKKKLSKMCEDAGIVHEVRTIDDIK